jgi:hypothetical protein
VAVLLYRKVWYLQVGQAVCAEAGGEAQCQEHGRPRIFVFLQRHHVLELIRLKNIHDAAKEAHKKKSSAGKI